MRKLMIFMLTAVVAMSCDMLVKTKEQGELRIAFAQDQAALTRAGMAIPDTSDFILTICDSKGRIIYEGAYGDSPESMSLEAGSYIVKVLSSEFAKPAFSSPQFAGMTPEMQEATATYVEQLKELTETLKLVAEQSARLTRDSEEMETMNRTLTGINRFYEMQLRSVSAQSGTIDEVHEQTKRLAQQLDELNAVYARMVEALKVNMK